MDNEKKTKYAHLYETTSSQVTPSPGNNKKRPDSGNGYLDDLKEIEHICTQNDLGDDRENQKLYRSLKNQNSFTTWLGEAFLSGLSGHTSKNRHRQENDREDHNGPLCHFLKITYFV